MLIPPLLCAAAAGLLFRSWILLESSATDGGAHLPQFFLCSAGALLALRAAILWTGEFGDCPFAKRIADVLVRAPFWLEALFWGGCAFALPEIYSQAGEPGRFEEAAAKTGAILAAAALWLVPLAMALSTHEWAHAKSAQLLGDDTATRAGRTTLNPFSHFSFFGLVAVPVLLRAAGLGVAFGWAKPVPVDFQALRDPRWGGAMVAAAGPFMNFACAAAAAALLRALPAAHLSSYGFALTVLYRFGATSLALGIFNLLPIHPLDGGRIASALLPAGGRRWMAAHEGKAAAVGFAVLLLSLNLAPKPALDALDSAVVGSFSALSGISAGAPHESRAARGGRETRRTDATAGAIGNAADADDDANADVDANADADGGVGRADEGDGP